MGLLILGLLHIGAIYAGCSIAQLEYVDIWRSVLIAFISYVVMIVISLVLIPLLVIAAMPTMFSHFLTAIIGAGILLLGTAAAAKMVLSLDWKESWIIAATAGVVNFLAGWMFSGCAS
jgi:hypothetical protein